MLGLLDFANDWLRKGGLLVLAAIVFAESGLLIGFFLPGDSLLFFAGFLASAAGGKVLPGGADYQNLGNPATIDARYLWQTADGEIIIVRNGGAFGSLVPTFEVRVDSPYAWLNNGMYLSSPPGPSSGGVALTFYESAR